MTKIPDPENIKTHVEKFVPARNRRLVILNADGSEKCTEIFQPDGKGVELGKKLLAQGFVNNEGHWAHPEGLTFKSKWMHVKKEIAPSNDSVVFKILGIDPKMGNGAVTPHRWER